MRRTIPNWLRKAFSFPVFLGVLLVLGVFLRARENPVDPDAWWHLAVGERILTDWTWPESDPYSFTVAGSPWIAYEWLGEVLMASALRLGGLQGHTFLLVLLASLFFLLLYYYSYLRSGNCKTALIACAALLPIAAVFFMLRPQLLGYSFLLLTLICLEHFRQGKERALWALPVIFVFWVNTHGTFSFGLATLGLCWLSGLKSFRWGGVSAERWSDRQRLQLELAMLLSVLALVITPYGTRVAAYPIEMALLQPGNIASITEWQPLGTDLVLGKMFLILLLAFSLALIAVRPTYLAGELAWLLFAVYAAVTHRRFLMIFIVAFAPLLAALLARWMTPYQPSKDHPALNAGLIAAAVVAMVWLFPSTQAIEEKVAKNYPQQALQFLRANPVDGPILNEYGWGGYLIWAAHPEHRVFIDGRADIYEYGGVLPDYVRIVRLDPEALTLLRKYDIRASLVRSDSALRTLLDSAPGWEPVHRDAVSTLFLYNGQPVPPAGAVAAAPPTILPPPPAVPNRQHELRQAALETVAKR